MDRGLLFACEEWEASVNLSATSINPQSAQTARAIGYYTDSLGVVQEGFKANMIATVAFDDPRREYTFECGLLGYVSPVVTRRPYNGGASIRFVLYNLKLFLGKDVSGNVFWRITWDSWRWFFDGALQHIGSSGALNGGLNDLRPSSIPILGIPMVLEVNPGDFVLTMSLTGASYSEVTVSANGGWRYKVGGSWVTPPVDCVLPSAPGGCGINATYPTGGATNTFNGLLSATNILQSLGDGTGPPEGDFCRPDPFQEGKTCHTCDCSRDCEPTLGDGFFSVCWYETDTAIMRLQGGRLALVPALPRSVQRGDDDYGHLVVRGGLPRARQRDYNECLNDPNSWPLAYGPPCNKVPPRAVISDFWSTPPGYARQSPFLDVATRSPSVIEEPMSVRLRAPYDIGGYAQKEKGIYCYSAMEGCECLGPGQSYPGAQNEELEQCVCGADFPTFFFKNDAFSVWPLVENPASAGALPYLAPSAATSQWLLSYATWYNFWANPHYSYLTWGYAPDFGSEVKWPIDGSPIEVEPYWWPLAEQVLTHPSLPGDKRLSCRTSLLSAGLLQSPIAYWASATTTYPTTFWGINRFKAREIAPTASFTLTNSSSSGWSATGGTLAHGGSITVTPSATTVTVRFELQAFDRQPWLYPSLARRITLGWSGGTITAAEARLVSVDGTTKAVIATTPGSYDLPRKNDTKFAGSWASAYGLGVISDTGTDTGGDGISSATMGSAERASGYQLTAGQQAEFLEIEFTLSGTGSTFTVSYPTFTAPTQPPSVFSESSQFQALVWPSGPGVRFGNLRYWDYNTESFLASPDNQGPGRRRSVLDIICYERQMLKPTALESGLDSVLTGLYDSGEIGSNVRKGAAEDTLAFFDTRRRSGASDGPPLAILVNTLAEVPPLNAFPLPAREPGTLAQTGAPAQESWDWAVMGRPYLVPGDKPLHMRRTSGGEVITTAIPAPIGWTATEHRRATDGSERLAFDAVHDGTKRGTCSPWHGYFFVGSSEEDAAGPRLSISGAYRHARAFLRDGKIFVGFAQNTVPLAYSDRDTGVTADALSIAYESFQPEARLWLLTQEGADIRLRSLIAEGGSLSMPTTIAAGKHPALVIGRNGLRYLYWFDGGAIKGQVRSSQNSILEATFTAIATADDVSFDAAEFVAGSGEHLIELIYVTGGNVTTATSKNGKSFS